MWLSIDTFQIHFLYSIHCKRMSLLNVESYVFINVFYSVLFCIHVCVDDVIKQNKKQNKNPFHETNLSPKVSSQVSLKAAGSVNNFKHKLKLKNSTCFISFSMIM